MHAFLRHLEATDFSAAPRVVGLDGAGNEVLTWLDGTVHAEQVWPEPERSPWQVVFSDERPTGLIGWEYCGPVDPVDEVAITAWYCAQLFDDDVAERVGLPPAPTRAEWFRCFLDGYGLARDERAGLVHRVLRFVIIDNGLWTLAWQSRAALWTLEHRDLLTRAAPR